MRKYRRLLLGILLPVIVCFAAVALAAANASSASIRSDVPAVAALVEEPDCEVLCSDNVQPYCDPGQHLAWNDDDGATWFNAMRREGAHPTTCFPGSCESEHDWGQCLWVGSPDELLLNPEELRQAIVAADAMEVLALLEAHPSQLSFNAKRSAIQLLACNGEIREHLSLTSEIAKHLQPATH